MWGYFSSISALFILMLRGGGTHLKQAYSGSRVSLFRRLHAQNSDSSTGSLQITHVLLIIVSLEQFLLVWILWYGVSDEDMFFCRVVFVPICPTHKGDCPKAC